MASDWERRDLAPLVRRVQDRFPMILRDDAETMVVVVLSELADEVGGHAGHHSSVRAKRLSRLDWLMSCAVTIDMEGGDDGDGG